MQRGATSESPALTPSQRASVGAVGAFNFWLDRVLVLGMVGVTVFYMVLSSMWRPFHDSQLMLYIGWLMEHSGVVPYRDLFDMNPPGTHLLHWGIVKLTGATETGQRLFDLAWLCATQLAIYALLHPYGRRVGVAAACLFSVQYLDWGTGQSLQREYLCMLPLCLSLLIVFRTDRGSSALRAFLVGVLHGFAISVKPPLGLAFPVVFAGLLLRLPVAERVLALGKRGIAALPGFLFEREVRNAVLLASLGLAIIPGLCALYLLKHGALAAFLETAREYWPLYAELRGDGTIRAHPFESRRFFEFARAACGYHFLGISALAAFLAFPRLFRGGARERVECTVLIGLVAAFLLYLYSTGKFWQYQSIPLYFAYSLVAGFALWRPVDGSRAGVAQALTTVVVAVLFAFPLNGPDQARRLMAGAPFLLPRDIDAVADLLTRRIEPGQSVQSLDVTSGAAHAMLLARVPLATRFLYDFHFYHHTDHAFILALRAELIAALESERPRFIVESSRSAWRPRGIGAGGFRELDELVERQYRIVYAGNRLTLRERRESASEADGTHGSEPSVNQ